MLSICHIATYVASQHIDIQQDYQRVYLTAAQAAVYARVFQQPTCPVYPGSQYALLAEPFKRLRPQHVADVAYLIHPHTSPNLADYGVNLVNRLKQHFGISHVQSFGLSANSCASALTALNVAEKLLQAAPATAKALILTGEKLDTPNFRSVPDSLCGDAATATVVSLHHARNRCLDKLFYLHPQQHLGLFAVIDDVELNGYRHHFVLNFKMLIEQLLQRNRLSLTDIRYWVPQNANAILWQRLAKQLDFPTARLYTQNIPVTTHCMTSDPFLNMGQLFAEEALRVGDYWIVLTVGVGGYFAAALFQH